MDNLSFEILKLFPGRKNLSLSQIQAIYNGDVISLSKPVNYLRNLGYLQIDPNFSPAHSSGDKTYISVDTPLVITYLGEIALQTEEKSRRKDFLTEFRAWVTLAIAIIALIVSIIALMK